MACTRHWLHSQWAAFGQIMAPDEAFRQFRQPSSLLFSEESPQPVESLEVSRKLSQLVQLGLISACRVKSYRNVSSLFEGLNFKVNFKLSTRYESNWPRTGESSNQYSWSGVVGYRTN